MSPALPRPTPVLHTASQQGSAAVTPASQVRKWVQRPMAGSIVSWSIVLGKLLTVSEPQFPHLKNGPKNNNVPRIKWGHADNVPGDPGY